MIKEILEFVWEVVKLLVPSFVAWKLAVYQSSKEAKLNEKRMKKQIEDWKNENIEAQNKSNKLQFCLKELSKIEVRYEKLISDVNVVAQSILRAKKDKNLMDVKMAAGQLNGHMHDIMYSIGLTAQLVKTLNFNDFIKFNYLLDNMKKSGSKIEKSMSYLAQIDGKPSDFQIINEVYNLDDFEQFSKDMFEARNFMMGVIDEILQKMG